MSTRSCPGIASNSVSRAGPCRVSTRRPGVKRAASLCQLRSSEVGTTSSAGRSRRPASFSTSTCASVCTVLPSPCHRPARRPGPAGAGTAATTGLRADRDAALPPALPAAALRNAGACISRCTSAWVSLRPGTAAAPCPAAPAGGHGQRRQAQRRAALGEQVRQQGHDRLQSCGPQCQARVVARRQQDVLIVADGVQLATHPAGIGLQHLLQQRNHRHVAAFHLNIQAQVEPARIRRVRLDVEVDHIHPGDAMAEIVVRLHLPAQGLQARHVVQRNRVQSWVRNWN